MSEPTNEQLANFLMVYARQIPEAADLDLSAPVLESLMSQNPKFRAGALRHHREFQQRINELGAKMEAGELQCEYIRPNGKQCPNHNQEGSPFCGLHQLDKE